MELFRLLGTIAINNDEANKAIEDTVGKGSEAQSKLSTAFGKIGSAAKTASKVIGAGMTAAVGAIVALGKSALGGYADFEQLVGGVETLFKDSAGIVRQYADEAYKSAGMSANAYMEQVTSFSASLIQSLDGDTQAAAEKANQAIIDMSDNANKMGTSIDMIQNAYQGFAKQNYTMLDNLKLGYGGTEAEMERLLADAQAISGIEYDITSYADVVDAIHVIQEEMGIAGTTAKEAGSTISGSISSMKSALTNLLAGLGNEDADLSGLTDNFVKSASTVMDNVLPRVEVILGGMVTVIEKLIPKLTEKLPSILQSTLPSLVTGATALTTGLIRALPSILQIIIEQLPFIVTEIATALIDTLPVLYETAKQMLSQLWNYIMSEVNSNGELDGIFNKISSAFSLMWDMCNTAWENIGKPIWDMVSSAALSLYSLFEENLPAIQAFLSDAFAGMQDSWENHLKPTFEAIGAFLNDTVKPAFEFVWQEIVEPLIVDTFSKIADLWNNTLKPVFDGICDLLTGAFTGDWQMVFGGLESIVSGAFSAVEILLSDITVNFENAVANIKAAFDPETMAKFFGDVWSGIQGAFSHVSSWLESTFSDAWQKVKDVFSTGGKIFDGIKEGIASTFITVVNGLIGGINKVISVPFTAINNALLGIKEIEIVGIKPFDWIESLETPELPTLSEAEFYAKGGVMTKPTIFGYNPASQKAMVGGEAGAEAIAPIETLKAYIAEAVASQNSAMMTELSNIMMNHANILVAAIAQLEESGIIKLDDPYKMFKMYRNQQKIFETSTRGAK